LEGKSIGLNLIYIYIYRERERERERKESSWFEEPRCKLRC
jgi:hypothetical protein